MQFEGQGLMISRSFEILCPKGHCEYEQNLLIHVKKVCRILKVFKKNNVI